MNGQEQSQSRLEESYDAAPADATTLPPWTNRNYLFKGRRSDQPHSGVLVFIPSSDIPFHSPECKVGRGYQIGAPILSLQRFLLATCLRMAQMHPHKPSRSAVNGAQIDNGVAKLTRHGRKSCFRRRACTALIQGDKGDTTMTHCVCSWIKDVPECSVAV